MKKFFVYKCKLGLALLYLPAMFISKLKHLENGFKYKNNSQFLSRNFPARTEQMPSKVLFVSKKKCKYSD